VTITGSAPGLTLGSSSKLKGFGTVTGFVNGPTSGTAGTITASGGTLEFKSAVDNYVQSSPQHNSLPMAFHIASDGTLKFDAAVGTSSIKPTITFDNTNKHTQRRARSFGYRPVRAAVFSVRSAGTDRATRSSSPIVSRPCDEVRRQRQSMTNDHHRPLRPAIISLDRHPIETNGR
jgi:hypothetical protein